MRLLIKGGRVISPANKIDRSCDILLAAGRISKIGQDLKAPGVRTIDAEGKIVMPGVVDMHVHLREPGREDKETVASATGAAAKGGVTSVLAMPNSAPAIDCAAHAELLNRIIRRSAKTRVFIAGAITRRRHGRKLSEIAALKAAGAIAITDDGSSVDEEGLFLRALQQAKENKLLLISHCEDKSLSKDGVVNLGLVSTRMGLRGISKESEYKRVQRDIALAQKGQAALHIAHLSCLESVEAVARAKVKGIKVTAETAPHYFSLNENELVGFNTNMKVNPPLRSRQDQEAIKQGLKSGAIDVIASDHAPHTESEKDIEFDRAAFGAIGLETELAVSITELVHSRLLDWPQLVEKLCVNPAKILGIDKGVLQEGGAADIIVLSPEEEWLVTKEDIVSKSKNSPFIGRRLKGVVQYTICGGKIVFSR